MGRSPCCSKEGLNRGAWTALEDKILTAYIKAHGEGKWRNLPKRAGLKRCGKSCRLRWLNYLRPDIKRGNISHDEEELIIRLHKLLGNRWSLIAGRLPGRTDNEIKNYWNTTLGKKASSPSSSPTKFHNRSPPPNSKYKTKKLSDINEPRSNNTRTHPSSLQQPTQVIRTKATRCTKVLIPPLVPPAEINPPNPTSTYPPPQARQVVTSSSPVLDQNRPSHQVPNSSKLRCGTGGLHQQTDVILGPQGNCNRRLQTSDQEDARLVEIDYENEFPAVPQDSLSLEGEYWSTTNVCLEDNASLDLESLAFLLDSEDWP